MVLFSLQRHGYVEETYYNYSVSPILVSKTSAKESLPMSLADSYIGGVLGVCVEVTEKVIHERRERTVRELGGRAGSATSVSDACRIAGQVFEKNPWDLPFSLVYLVEGKKTKMATLQGSSGFKLPHPAAPPAIPLGELSAQYPTTPFPIHQVLSTGKIMTSSLTSASAATYFTPPFTSSVWPELPDTAVSLPIRSSFGDIVGCLVIGVSPRRRIDKSYRSFQELVARQLGNNLNSARASEEEKEKLRIMEELDKAKTDFFSSVSHEFRTPITLILGPVEEMLSTVTGEHAGKMKEIGVDVERMQSELRMVRRNALRLSKLVTSLLDFSRLEAGRMQARYARTDLAPFVKDLCGVFRSAVERAGLRFVVDVDAYALASPSVTSDKRDLNPASSHYAYVDRDMFEKIVYNLLSNALKNTLKGEIRVTLIRRGGAGTGGSGESSASSDTASIDAEEYAVLIIEDTGVGIAPQDLPRIFERFYRAEHSSRRSIEGTGIGLPLTRELVKMHGGKVRVTSEIDKGTRFEVKIPLGWGHLRRECVTEEEESSGVGDLYVEEAMGWMSEIGDKASPMGSHPVTHGSTDSLPPWNETGKGAGVSSETVVASADSHDGGTSETNVPITPITLDPTLPVTWSLTGAHAHRSTNPYILICDDNPDMASYLKSLFSPHFPLHICRNGLEAFQAAKHRPPGLILSDVMMPVMNGFELIRRIRNDPDLQLIPVILLSARAGEEARVEGLMHGADDYLAKPFGAKELVARVRTHLELGRLRNDLENLARLSPVGVFRLSREGIVYRSRRLVEISGVAMKFQKNMRGRTLPHGDESFEWDSDVLSVDGVHEEDKEKIRDAIKRTFETGEGDKVAYRYVKRRPGRAAIEGAHSPSSPSTQPGRPTSPNGDPNESGAEEDDAEVVHVIAEWHPEFDLHNRVVGLIGAVTDITDQVLSQRRQLADAEEMRKSQEALIDMISHEIRNPINAIYNNVDLLRHGLEARRKRAKEFFTWLEKRVFAPHKLEEGEGKPSMGTVITAQDEQYFREVYQELHSLHSYDAEALQAIEACAKHQRVIADDVLHLSKLKSGSISIFKRVFKPRELVDGVSAMFKAEMDRKGIEFRVEVRGMGEGGVLAEDDGVWGDPDRLGQVLINLLSNAVKFTEKVC
ncbi:hypothetical protein BC832DRAFT_364102 [Gaertneriomyces semiglobifer]|nr:hypothetical protein BC832DRAFT_364102 [Gaertneriomyces semiglobifer]